MSARERNDLLPTRLFVGLDEQGLADGAARAAFRLAERFDARVELLHAVPELPDAWPGVRAFESMERSAHMLDAAKQAALAHVDALLAKESRARHTAHELLRVVAGHPAEALLAAARAKRDWIVLGARRPTGLLHFGGTLRRLLSKATCPVWVQSGPELRFERILAPVDLSEASLRALEVSVAFAGQVGARVHVLHAFDLASLVNTGWPEEYGIGPVIDVDAVRATAQHELDQAMERVDWRGVRHEHELVQDDPVRAILAAARANDVVVMGTHGHSGVAAALLGNIAWSVMEHCDTPLLVVH